MFFGLIFSLSIDKFIFLFITPRKDKVYGKDTLEPFCNHWRNVMSLFYIPGAFNKFSDFFVQAFKIVVDSWKFIMLLLYILWDDWLIFMISGSNEQLQQELE